MPIQLLRYTFCSRALWLLDQSLICYSFIKKVQFAISVLETRHPTRWPIVQSQCSLLPKRLLQQRGSRTPHVGRFVVPAKKVRPFLRITRANCTYDEPIAGRSNYNFTRVKTTRRNRKRLNVVIAAHTKIESTRSIEEIEEENSTAHEEAFLSPRIGWEKRAESR